MSIVLWIIWPNIKSCFQKVSFWNPRLNLDKLCAIIFLVFYYHKQQIRTLKVKIQETTWINQLSVLFKQLFLLQRFCDFSYLYTPIAFESAKVELPTISFISCFDHQYFLGGQENFFTFKKMFSCPQKIVLVSKTTDKWNKG